MDFDPVVTGGDRPKRNFVEFHHRSIQSQEKTEKEQRPIFESVEFVRICPPGDKTLEVVKRVTDTMRREYALEYAAFQQGKSQAEASGTPLSALGFAPERVEEYAYHKVKTVEQLAAVSDGNIQGLGHGVVGERRKALDYLEVMKGNASITAMKVELAKRDEELAAIRADLAEMKKLARKGV